ncbi:MAG: extracellular solute-binding protein [Microbacteriaceae bacterium]|nr:extracellular solute-binding protein [Microbacteriaceae bacterium]MCL2794128.1 extracellular solute-binding protein [Microbacteriaceae bacterium]
MSQQLSRRQFGLAVTGLGATFLLAACGTSATPGAASNKSISTADEFKKASLTFAFWGNPVRNAYTDQIIKAYTAAHPAITVAQQPGEWATYWTKLSTQVAGGTAPDIIQMDQAYIAEYGGRGALLDLSKVATIDTAPLKSTLAAGTLNGKLYGIPTGNNAYAIGANKTLFDKAGVALPDDKTWTWDDFLSICHQLTQGSGGKFRGTNWFGADQELKIWLYQNGGEQLYTASGKLGASTDNLTSFFAFVQKLFASGDGPTKDEYATDIAAAVQQTLFGTNKVAMEWMWSNQVTAYQQANGGDVVLLRIPSAAGSSAKNGVYFKPSMYWSISSQSKAPAQAGGLINDFLNSTAAGALQLAERGVPANPAVLAVVQPKLSATDQIGVNYLESIKSEVTNVPPVPPKGTSTVAAVVQRHEQDVIFGRATPAAAAAAFKTEVEGLISSAS